MKSLVIAALAALSLSGAHAADPAGVAFVQAPEQGIGTYVQFTAKHAFACAKLECAANGGSTESCKPVKWCFPSGWSANIVLLHNEGIHWHEFACGWASRDAALEAAKVFCNRKHRDFVVDCKVVQLYDPSGMPQLN